jgi:hypothetical protein
MSNHRCIFLPPIKPHPVVFVTTIVIVIIGTVLVYLGMHIAAQPGENGSDLKFKKWASFFIPFLLGLSMKWNRCILLSNAFA